ncbi:hypothetical protein acsn021_11300 [Anaerocolumna cellulosilytica]|uniref:Uncharacterized protein n=1 Tax=Anaerocolumna cellulosilytica TaxID=433286 RepID=A0A6S6R333_9FIRM|nr:hypothetical protein acsn021_11300 [Anaerocolumna cellulosilytica]
MQFRYINNKIEREETTITYEGINIANNHDYSVSNSSYSYGSFITANQR